MTTIEDPTPFPPPDPDLPQAETETVGRFVAEATRALNASLDEATTISTLARFAIEGFADWCAIDLVDAQGALTVTSIAHRDPTMTAYAYELRKRYPLDPDGPIGPYAVLRSASSQYLPAIPSTVVDEVTGGDPEQAAILERLAIRSFMCVPLAAQGSVIGTLSAVSSAPGRQFTESDLRVAEEVAARAAAALLNARLYERVVQAADRERTRAAELRAVIDALSDGVLVFDARGDVLLANEAAVAALGARPRSHAEVLDRLAERDLAPGPGDPVQGVEVPLAGDAERWVELTAAAVPGLDKPEWVMLVRDVTTRHLVERVRDTFVDVLSHELRTPVTSMTMAADLLLRDEAIDDRTRGLLADLRSEGERLRLLVEDVLALTRFGDEPGTEPIPAEPVLLQHVVPVIVEGVRHRFPEASFDVTSDPDLPPVSADTGYVEHVLRNLIGNAAKFGGDGAHVSVVLAREDDDVVTRVLDRGPGFASGEEVRVFRRFYRSPATASVTQGSGIGLFVAARLVAAMGGRIWARGRSGGGAEVGFSLRSFEASGLDDSLEATGT